MIEHYLYQIPEDVSPRSLVVQVLVPDIKSHTVKHFQLPQTFDCLLAQPADRVSRYLYAFV